MSFNTIIEFIGYIGSFLVIVSMLMTSLIKLRVINTIGSVIFAIYALIIHSYPTAIMQFCLIIINVINLFKLFKNKKEYSVIKLNKNDNFINYFEAFYKNDINKFFPEDFNLSKAEEHYMVCCGSNPAGILSANYVSKDELNVILDYASPSYRDCSVGKHLYNYLAQNGIKKLHVKQNEDSGKRVHSRYLRKMGFSLINGEYIKNL